VTPERLKVLILGGYGTFGGRLAQLLDDDARLTLLIAGRSRAKAEGFCAGLTSCATKVPCSLDRDGDLHAQLRDYRPDVIVDASGPFQAYGGDHYRLVRAAIELGIHYLDLADGSDFVQGIAALDAAARERNVLVLSGVSSFPVLTAAVVRSLAADMSRIDTVTGGIAPSPHAKVGINVIRAIAGYAGRPVKIRRDGRASRGIAFVDTRRYTIAPPGRVPLRPTRFSLVDVPDLLVLPELWPQVRSVWMGAGPVPDILHRLLNALAWTVRLRLLPSAKPLAAIMHRVMNVVPWGEHRGGMFVEVRGTGSDGAPVERSWHLLAEGDDGPLIPSMAAAAVIRRVLDGRPPAAGARPGVTDLELADYVPLFAPRRIYTGYRLGGSDLGDAPLYRRLLGEAWSALPGPLQTMHDLDQEFLASGLASVERGTGLRARCAAALFGFPPSGENVPVQVSFAPRKGREVWRRTFAGRPFSSVQSEGRGRYERLLVERFVLFTFGLALVVEDGRLHLVVRRWSVCGIPLRCAWAPRGNSYEFAEASRFNFHV